MSQETVSLLVRIEAHLASIDRTLAQLAAQRRATAPKAIASDRDLDGHYGDPTVKFNPRDWAGQSCKGRRMSECPADFLELLAGTFDYFADQAEKNNERTNGGKPVADYKRADAARARGWAKRIRDGKHVPTKDAAFAEPESEWATSGEGF